jgi:hypothetical protein
MIIISLQCVLPEAIIPHSAASTCGTLETLHSKTLLRCLRSQIDSPVLTACYHNLLRQWSET